MQLPLWAPESSWLPPKLEDLPQDWNAYGRMAIDVETKDPFLKALGIGVRRGGHIIGYSLTFEDGPSYYLPVRHEGGGNMDVGGVLEYMRTKAAEFEGIVVGANLQYDIDYLWEEKIFFPKIKYFRDVQIADGLINELHRSYSLQAIAERHNLPGKDQELLNEAANAFKINAKAEMYKLHSKYVGPYATQDTIACLPILRKLERIIDEKELWPIYNLESEVQPVLVKMRRRGVRIDLEKLSEVERWSKEEETKALAKVRELTGVQIRVGDVWKAEALVPVLHFLQIPIQKTKTGKASIRKDILDDIKHPAADALLWARKVNKLRTTFAQSIRDHMVNGRIHCTFNQMPVTKEDDADDDDSTGARYGRLSCVEPNLQQQPSRDEFASMWRSIYIPEEGMLWASNDYSQQEPRMLVHYAELSKLPRAKEAGDKYRQDPNTDNHQMMAEMAGIARKPAKELFLGKCYGMGGAKLCRKLHLPTRWVVYFNERGRGAVYFDTKAEAFEYARQHQGRASEAAGMEGQAIIDKFDAELPFVHGLAKYCEKEAKKRGSIITVLGRHCRFPVDDKGQYDWTYKALNRLIQGSSADQTKRALVEIDKAGHYLQLQVHDEVACSVKDVAEAKAIADIMINCVPLRVPSKVDVEIGPSWGEAKGVE